MIFHGKGAMKRRMVLLILLLLLGYGYSNAQYGPVVSFTYDDGYPNWYDIGFPVFQEYGFPGVVYVNALSWWVTGNGYGAVDKLIEMQEAGWEISSHTYDHQGIDSLNVCMMKDWLDSLGFTNSGFAAPGHDWSHEKVNIVKTHHPYYSATGSQEGGHSQPFDLYFLTRLDLTNNKTIEEVRGYLDDAVANNKWIIFYAHEFGGTYGDGSGWYQCDSLLRMTFDEIVARWIPVKTVKEVITDLFPPGCVIECSVDSLQDPGLTYFEEGEDALSTSVWNEYWHNTPYSEPRYIGSPVVYCHTSNDSLPVMKFYRNVPDGEYEVIASIIAYDPGRTYRLYYSFDSLNTSQYNVEVNENNDVSLGTVTVTDGQFVLYTQKADAVTGEDGYVGWAFVKLFAQQNQVLFNAKVFLEGPYNGNGAMTPTLNTNDLIPLSSEDAYPAEVHSYTASNVTIIPNSDIVDWVLVELRTGTTSETKVATRAAFLKNDGTIVDTDGSSPVTFTGLSDGNYYVVVRHRNHLAIMSASAIPLSKSSTLYDFTTSQSQAYGTLAMKVLSDGLYGMPTGDGNQDGLVTSTDFNIFNPKFTNAVSGYEYSDWNLDGIITSTDFNFFNPNFTTAKQSLVP